MATWVLVAHLPLLLSQELFPAWEVGQLLTAQLDFVVKLL